MFKPPHPRLKGGEIVIISGVRYRADFWYPDRVYELITVDSKHAKHHGKQFTEGYISEQIKLGKIKRLN